MALPMPGRISKPVIRALSLSIVLFFVLVGCRCRPTPSAARPETTPALRLALLSGASGAIEPCGCVKDMLGGVDHAGAYLRAASDVPLLALGAGPMLFMDPELKPDRVQQDRWKAEAMVASLRELGVRAFAPGMNDYALGAGELAELTKSGPSLLAANLSGASGGAGRMLTLNVGAVRVGVVGISTPKQGGKSPEGLKIRDPRAELEKAGAELRQQGVPLRVALMAMPRGEALRLIEAVTDFQLVLLGKAVDRGEANDPITPPMRVGNTLVIEAPNHLQALYVVDFFVKDGKFEFVDAAGDSEEASSLDRRISDLEQRIAAAEKAGNVAKSDLDARRRDLADAKARKAKLQGNTKLPHQSYYRTKLVEVRERLGTDDKVKAGLDAYYQKVNEHNRVAFKDRKPAPVPEGASGFVGVALCASCHQQEFAFWSGTRHASAYATLSRQNKQFNLDCVGCHVTGYEEPGGSTVVAVDTLMNVQCETCHGPGSRHVANPADLSLIQGSPAQELCGPKCHHPPHVKPDWTASAAWPHILGPGHGRGR
jgi:hypothetical protein